MKIASYAALAAVLLIAHATAAETVRTTGGAVSGVATERVESFKGIPFAAPPVGDLRWKAPAPPAPWTGVRSGAAFGPACPQHLPPAWGATPAWSEDCLYLNVWKPEGARPGGKLPVMVWIYGGGFTIGYGGSKIYDGSNLVKDGVIVVNMNYRLGRLGWFAHPLLTKEAAGRATGDYGLMDQIAALKWVRANIAAFGGDPANVTIFGESAGGMSVNLLMTSPAAKGLFAKAITESGLGRIPAKTLAKAEAQGAAFAQAQHAPDLLTMRAIPVETLIANAPQPEVDWDAGAGPIVDGVIVPENVDAAFAAGREAKVPWMVGSNDYEASLFPGMIEHPEPVLARVPAEARPFMIGLFDPDKTGDQHTAVANILSDSVFTEPARFLAARHTADGAPTYRYFFAYVPEAQRASLPGAGHGAEIQFVFGTLGTFYRSAGGYSANDRKVSAEMGRYWTNFAKTGNPNGEGLPNWAPDTADQVLVIDKSGEHTAEKLRKTRLDVLQSRAKEGF